MWIVVAIIGFFLGLFGFSQIVYPLFFAWPLAKQLKRNGKLKRKIPLYTFIFGPIIWSVLIIGSIWLVKNIFTEYLKLYYIVMILSFIIVLAQLFLKNPDLETDFLNSWEQYLK